MAIANNIKHNTKKTIVIKSHSLFAFCATDNFFVESILLFNSSLNPSNGAVAESFFKTLKKELVRKTIFHTRAEARDKIFEYIEMFYNSKKRHSFLDFISPNELEKRYNPSLF
ncbi:IS3 family transposase [Aliarcobacter butzleri]